eukprot:TRINITY_DN8069_c0_g1_i2.p1 TRINITY_DN8069_c0_g1~~TRINITY_DN8069_c0_g1_i2.p1  ORF type:complete len:413 (-),score=127.96 TRINITY_DN8069_c0_g1_i2:61-1299(-)
MFGGVGCPYGYGSKPAVAEDDVLTNQNLNLATVVGEEGKQKTENNDNNAQKKKAGTYYHSYLALDKILEAQFPKSEAEGAPAHDEMLFIIMHQTHELWFKQMLHDLESCQKLFNQKVLPDKDLLVIVTRLKRVTEIFKVLIPQLRVLESMTPMDFLDFRDFLFPASGFQSVQFRVLENVLGLKRDHRIKYKRCAYTAFLSEEHQKVVTKSEEEQSLLELVDAWLCRTPFLQLDGFDFWESYKECAEKLFQQEVDDIEQNTEEGPDREERLESVKITRDSFESLFSAEKHGKLKEMGKRRMSHKAWKSALFINLYRHLPVLQMPFQILNLLVDIDELLTSWRVAHSLMVHRTLGMKSGTGGSSGYEYLKATATMHKCFPDLFNISEYLLPKSKLPKLPPHLASQLDSNLHQTV